MSGNEIIAPCMTPERCKENRKACREYTTEMVKSALQECMGQVMGQMGRMELVVQEIDEKLEDTLRDNKLFISKIHELELWRAEHEARVQGSLRTRAEDNGIVFPKWAVMASIPLMLLIIALAALAGEKILPFLFSVGKPPTP